MKNITFSAEERDIERARALMRSQNRTLNDAFREWLQGLSKEQRTTAFHQFLDKTSHWDLGGPYTREQMNERR